MLVSRPMGSKTLQSYGDFLDGIRILVQTTLKDTLMKQQRTSDSLNEGLPIKMTREKFQIKLYFFYEKDSRFNPRLIHKSRFLIAQVPIGKYGLKTQFLLFNK